MEPGPSRNVLSYTHTWVQAHGFSPADALSPVSGLSCALHHQHLEADYNTPKRRLSLSDSSSGTCSLPAPSPPAQLTQEPAHNPTCHDGQPVPIFDLEFPSSQESSDTVMGDEARDGVEERALLSTWVRSGSESETTFTALRKSSGGESMDVGRSVSQLTNHSGQTNCPTLRVPINVDGVLMSPSQSSVFAEGEDSRDSGYVDSNSGFKAPLYRPIRRPSKRSSGSKSKPSPIAEDEGIFERLEEYVNLGACSDNPIVGSLIGGPIIFDHDAQEKDKTPRKVSCPSRSPLRRRRVFSQFPNAGDKHGDNESSSPVSSMRLENGKRGGLATSHTSPVKRKRSAFANVGNVLSSGQPVFPPTKTLTRCYSEADAWAEDPEKVLHVFERDTDIIGDHTRPHVLPSTQHEKINDMKSINGETVAALLDGKYADDVEECHIVDCRYPYEFEAGHVRGARNVYMEEDLHALFLSTPQYHPMDPTSTKRRILIFYCEYSSERGPKMCRELRRSDRKVHGNCYPRLYYPEIYLMEYGYKEFYANFQEHCDPQNYRSMFDPAYRNQCQHFKAKSKSFDGTGATVARRSRCCRARRPLEMSKENTLPNLSKMVSDLSDLPRGLERQSTCPL